MDARFLLDTNICVYIRTVSWWPTSSAHKPPTTAHRMVRFERLDNSAAAIKFWLGFRPEGANHVAARSWSIQNAKNQFSEVVEAARCAPQTVTKHGKPAVVIVDITEYERLRRLERAQAPSFSEVLLAMPQDDGEFSRRRVHMRANVHNTTLDP